MFGRAGASGSFLLAAVCAAAVACGEAPAGDEVSRGGAEITATDDDAMGLRLTYDEPSGTLRATVQRALSADEKLLLRVRRARLTPEAAGEIDCTYLPEAPPLASAVDGSEAADVGPVVYLGPHVDVGFLATVYDEQWVMERLTPEVLDALQREGVDAIVEACVVAEDGSTRARLQSSLQDAWDQSDPRLASPAPAPAKRTPL